MLLEIIYLYLPSSFYPRVSHPPMPRRVTPSLLCTFFFFCINGFNKLYLYMMNATVRSERVTASACRFSMCIKKEIFIVHLMIFSLCNRIKIIKKIYFFLSLHISNLLFQSCIHLSLLMLSHGTT